MMLSLFSVTQCLFGQMLVAWDGGAGGASATNVTGVSATLRTSAINDVVTNGGSTDGTFGPDLTGAASGQPAYRVLDQSGKNRLSFEIVNNTGSDLNLEMIVFDYSTWFADSPTKVRVQYREGNLAMADFTEIANITVAGIAGKLADYEDFSISLDVLSDTVLSAGQRATFDLVAYNANRNDTAGAFDNVGITGSAQAGLKLVALSR